jgi:hypothetical protein
MGNDDTTREYCALSNALIHLSYLVSRRKRKPWVMAPLALFVSILCIQTNSNNMAGLWLSFPYLLECAMEVFACNKPWLQWPTAVQDSPRTLSGAPPLDYLLQELARISTLLLTTGSSALRLWLGPKFLEPSLSQFSYSVLFLFLPLCLAPVTLICVQRLGRPVEFSYDQEAQDTVEIPGGLQWPKGLRMGPGVQSVAHSKQVYIESAAVALFIILYLISGKEHILMDTKEI